MRPSGYFFFLFQFLPSISSGTVLENHKTEPDIFLAQAVDNPTRSLLSSAVDKENDLTFLRNKHEETPRGKLETSAFAVRGLVSTLLFFCL